MATTDVAIARLSPLASHVLATQVGASTTSPTPRSVLPPLPRHWDRARDLGSYRPIRIGSDARSIWAMSSRAAESETATYRCVVLGSLWPNIFWTVSRSPDAA